MPTFVAQGDRHFISYITGPSHVLLGIRFVPHPAEPVMVKQPARHPGSPHRLDVAALRAAVVEALADGAAESGRPLHAAEIVYVEDDRADAALLGHVARLLVARHLSGEPFKQVPAKADQVEGPP